MRHCSFSSGGRRRRRHQQQQKHQPKYGGILLSFVSMVLPSVVATLVLLMHAPIGSTFADTIVIKANDDDDGTFDYEKAIVRDIPRVIDMAWTNDGRVLIAAKKGEIYVFAAGDLVSEENRNSKQLLYNVDPCTEQERALLSIVVHPQFGTTTTTRNGTTEKEEYNYVYAYWVHKGRNGNCAIPEDFATVDEDGPYCQLSRFTLTASNQLQNEKVLLRTGNAGKMHNGGGMGFGSDGYLYLATGDTGYSRSDDPANNLDNLWGKILRIKDDGTIPSDNPYVRDKNSQVCGNRIVNPGNGKSRVCTEIFAQGLRNPFSLVMNPNTKNGKTEFYVSDVGRTAWEEINVGGTGYEKANYGWREREGPCKMGRTNSVSCGDVDGSKFVDPIHFYQHPSDTGAACVGGAFIPNGIWPQEYDNEYLYSDLRAKSIFHMKRDANNECRGTKCNKQRSKFDSVPIVQDIEGHSVLRLRFGPYNSKQNQDQMSLYHLLYDSGTINRLTYIKKKKNSSDDSDDDNQKPTSTIETLYSSDSGGVTVRFDGSKSSDPDGDKLNFHWAFGDNSENDSDCDDGVAATTSYTYQNPGQFTATLKVSDGKGKTSNTATVKINVDTDYHRSSDSDHGVPTLTTFPWSNKCDGYQYDDDDTHIDQCGVLEFCFDNDTKTYGYQIGEHGIEGKCRTLTMGLAPVIRLQPGFTYRMTLRNLAPASTSTNIHTHGLHVVGSGNGDDITRIVKGGGMCMDYTWDIRPDHPGGTYWYHPHAHSRSEIQVNGGATGLLIVEDNVNNNNDIPSWASNELLLQILRLDDGNKMLSNGRSYEIFNIMNGKWYRLRISTVDPLGVAQELRFTAGCEVHKVASDGIWHSVVPFDNTSENVNNNTFQMTGSSRGDFALRCNSWESINILFGGKLTAIINIKSGTSSNLRNEVGRWEPKRPSSLQSMDSIVVPNENQLTIKIERDSINGKEWDPDVPLQSLAFNKVYQFDLPDTQRHPFHIHLYHMQVMTPNGCGSGYVEGEFYDTISAEPCTVRFRTSDFGQRLVVHCHVMLHSDLGSMAWFDVKGEGMPLYELTAPYHDYSGNNLPTSTPTPAPIALYKDGAEKCKVFDELPFTAEAMQFCDYSDTTTTNQGDEECGTGPVDLKLLEDNSSCDGDCYIAFTSIGEYVTYKFQTDSNVQGDIQIKVRVASSLNKMKKFRLTLLDENLESGVLYTTGKGYKVFEEVVWELSGIPKGLHRLRVDFISDNINLCTISVETNESRIVGGNTATVGKYPYFVDMGGCGGALISPYWVLTAAHCGSKKNKTLIIGAFKKGNSNLGNPEQRICQEWYQDPQFSYRGNIKPPFFNDFALCRLNTPVYNKEFLQVNSMANWPANPTSDLTVIGMGTTQYQGNSATALREVQVPLVPIQTCINKYSASQIKDPEIICASDNGRDACQGDSGGPLIYTHPSTGTKYHIGTVSWGYECARADSPGVYSRTSSHSEWIQSKICTNIDGSNTQGVELCGAPPTRSPTRPPTPPPTPSNIPIATSFPLPPITWGALDYHEAFEKTAESSFGDGCNIRGDGVDGKRVKDNTCKVRDGSKCFVGWWDPGEYLLYRFSIPPGSVGMLDIRVRVATKREGRDIGFELMDMDGMHILQSNSSKVPAEGWQNFVDVVWKSSVDLEPNNYILKVVSTTGFVNLCSTSITPTQPDPDDEEEEEEYTIVVPGYYSAMYYADTDFYDTTPDRLGNCPYRKDRPVDAKKNKDSICNQAITVPGYDTQCHIAFTDKNEFLSYNVKKAATQTMVQISLRVASKRSRRILVELEGSDRSDEAFVGINKVIQTPGNDANSFKIYDTIVVWEQVDIGTAEKYKLKLVFLDGKTDLCSIGIEYVSIVI